MNPLSEQSSNRSLFDQVVEIPMPEPSCRVWALISMHKGRESAISLREMYVLTGFHERVVQQIVHQLVVDHQLPVASTSDSRQPGYYIPADERESIEHFRSLLKRGLRILKRAHAFHQSDFLAEFLGQAELEIAEEAELR